jgi:hypothetical protein
VLQIRQDFVAVPVLLMAELIAGKSQDNKLKETNHKNPEAITLKNASLYVLLIKRFF